MVFFPVVYKRNSRSRAIEIARTCTAGRAGRGARARVRALIGHAPHAQAWSAAGAPRLELGQRGSALHEPQRVEEQPYPVVDRPG